MWLDRFGGPPPGATPSPSSNTSQSRAQSPLPRRTSSVRAPYLTSQRPGLVKRGSSMSLVSNDSSSSLLGMSKRANGSGLKQSTLAHGDAPDPETVLASILGPPPSDGKTATITTVSSAPPTDGDQPTRRITEEDLEAEFDFGGLSLRELAGEEADTGRAAPAALDTYRPQTVEDYEREKAKYEELHRSIRACDDILSSVESSLTSFRDDLAAVSADIETLQARSTALNVRLENRKAVEKALAPVVEELSVSPMVVSKISEGHIDEAWVKILAEVDRRTTAHKKNAQTSETKALADVGPLLEKLVLKAVERIRDFLVAQIKALRSPNINAQIIQQQNFLKFKELYAFLHRHQPVLAGEICQAYLNTMRWYYLNQFSRYQKALEKLKLHIIDKNDVLGHDDTSRRATVLSGSSRAGGSPHDAFNLGRRIDVLHAAHQPAISSYLAEEDTSTHYLEVPFRNFNVALIDNATAEYSFLAAFFTPSLSFATIARHFNYIFDPTFALGQALTKSLVADTFDALGVLLCVRINQRLAFELQRRRIPAADGYINGTAMALWPRLQSIMDAHCESVRALAAALPSKPASASSARAASAAPHVVTQRFGQLLHGVLALSADAGGDEEPVGASLRRLRNEVEGFLGKAAQSMFGGADQRKRDRFLYNNYSLVLTIIGDVGGKLAEEEQGHFEELKARYQEVV